MTEILQASVPYDTRSRALPGVRPMAREDWLMRDDAFAEQMALRGQLLSERREAVLAVTDAGRVAADELLSFVLDWLQEYDPGYEIGADSVRRPDGIEVEIDQRDPMGTLGYLVQEDLCLMERQGDVHVLTAAVLCFPASWRLSDKIGRPLVEIHAPVPEYDDGLARRVQRLFDGVQVERPLWRFNALHYAQPDLHQPWRKEGAISEDGATVRHPYFRSERQCVLRLPQTRACVFSIHTFVVRAAD
ncbi:heme-dependent oxidative N-demethylase family protein [Roseovarius aestuariivivens]|uniref:heme-dependent oxidative N-demethylase family protein n=1 Tax=Roseovarius aestuariivivens TaxID=1888910 RepID=UPI001080D804|nr:DUF3445 domain-containing protein [Roseovarius aestuariivivens]